MVVFNKGGCPHGQWDLLCQIQCGIADRTFDLVHEVTALRAQVSRLREEKRTQVGAMCTGAHAHGFISPSRGRGGGGPVIFDLGNAGTGYSGECEAGLRRPGQQPLLYQLRLEEQV